MSVGEFVPGVNIGPREFDCRFHTQPAFFRFGVRSLRREQPSLETARPNSAAFCCETSGKTMFAIVIEG